MTTRRKIQYRFYRKPMATNLVTDFNSAHSLNSKIATLSQDVYRILANCSPDTETVEKCTLVEDFIDRLKVLNITVHTLLNSFHLVFEWPLWPEENEVSGTVILGTSDS